MTDAAGSEVRVQLRADAEATARLAWTSVPRWPAPELPAAASYLACWFGAEARRRVRALLADAEPGVPVRSAGFAGRWNAGTEAELRRLIGECRMGARIVLVGPEAIVMRAKALAGQLGATGEEIVPVAIEAMEAAEAIEVAETAVPQGCASAGITARSAERPAPADLAQAQDDSGPAQAKDGSPPFEGRYVAGPAARRVFCAACRGAFDAVAAIGGIVTCPGCASELIVDRRFSRPHAAYFGWPTGLDLHQ